MTCQGCGAQLPPKTWRGRDRKWCSDLCRKNTLYGGTCEDCGVPTSYAGRGVKASPRCVPCRDAANLYWTKARIVLAFQDFDRDHGRAPRVTDFSPAHARLAGQVVRVPEGRWPRQATVYQEFGSWKAAVLAAGLRPFDHARDHSWSPGNPLHERKAA